MITVIDATYDHMADWADYIRWDEYGGQYVIEGRTVRNALKHLREIGQQGFGDIGECTLYLSDGSFIAVENRATEGGKRMCTQRIVRYDKDFHQQRVYSWT